MKTNVQAYCPGNDLSKSGLSGKGTLPALISFSLSILILILFTAMNAAGQNSATFTTSTSWLCPAGVTCVKVEAWGAGGGGSTATSNSLRGGGGGGGAYATSFVTVIPGNTYTITVGTGGSANSTGGDSWFITNTTVMAKGGVGGTLNSATAGSGGLAINSFGSVKFDGGNGAAGGGTNSGGGGGGAGSTGIGQPASGVTGGLGAALNGGNGGNGVTGGNNGKPGFIYGGGGSGAATNSGTDRIGGTGANGLMKLTWVNISSFSTSASSPLCSNAASTITVSSFSLAAATYTVTYDLSGANSSTGNTASMNFTGTTGTFTTSPLTNGGATTITITGIAFAGPVCNTNPVSSGNTASITVNTTPSVSATPASQTSCTGTPITQIDITNPNNVPGTLFTWTRTTPANLSGIASSGSGPSISGTFANSSTTPITTTFTITATAGSCSSSTTVTVTVNPVPTVSVTNTSQTVCSETAITNIVITNPNNVPGVTFNWTRDNTTNLSGLVSGTGSPISGILTNNTLVQQTTEFSITASLGSCSSVTALATVIVNPAPSVSATPASQTVCSGTALTQIDITNPNAMPGTTFTWTRTTAPGLAGITNSGSGTTINGTFTNSTGAPITSTFTITATAGGCSTTTTVTVTVNPIPTINAVPATQTLCSGTAITNIVITNPNAIAGTTFSWTRDNTVNLTGMASGTGSPISGTLINNTSVQQTTVFTITASNGSCSSPASTTTVTVIINPTPSVNSSPSTQTICSGTAISQIDITNPNLVPGTNLTWVRNNTVNLTGIASSGSGSVITGTLTNATAVQQTTTFTVTATAGSCSSTTTVNVIVNPAPIVNNIANVSYCNGVTGAAIPFGSNIAGSTFAWSSTANVGFGVSGTGNIPSFTAINGPVTATVSVTATVGGCPGPVKTFTITINPLPSVTVSADYCIVPGKVRLTANPSPTGTYSYLWSTNATSSVIDVDIAGSYTVTVTNANGCKATNSISIATELAVNGNFEAGNVGFTTGFNYVPGANGLQPEGNYAVNNNANFNHTNFWGSDHTTGTGKFMIVNGLVGPTVWQETVPVVPNTTYYFSAWALSMNNLPPFAQLQFSVNGNVIGVSAVLVAGVTNNSNSNWQRFYGVWSSGALTTATCSIVDLQGALGGNDFGLDDISISTLSPAAFTVTPSVVGGGTTVCTGATLNLSANLTGGSSPYTFSWTGPGGFTSNLQNPSISNVTAANSGTYTLNAIDFYGCTISGTRDITVSLPAAPSPVTATPATICLGSSTNLNGTALPGTQSDFTGFYATGNWTTTNNPALTGGSVNISGAPTLISITSGDNGTIGNTDYTITNGLVAGNYVFNWSYRANDLASNDIPQYSINGGAAINLPGFNTTGANIQSGTATIAVPANQTFALRMRTVNGTLGSATVTITNFSGPVAGNINWYTVPTAGSSIGTSLNGANFSVTPASSGVISYYAQATSSIGCASSTRTQVNVTVNQPSVAASSLNASPNVTCSGDAVTLTQSGGSLGTGASWKWYSNNLYTTLVGTGSGPNASLTVNPLVTSTYYLRIEGTSSPCTANATGPAAGVTVTVRQPSVSPTSLNASSNPICRGSSTTLTQAGGNLGTGANWKWYSDNTYTTFVGNGSGATASLTVSPLVTTTYYLRAEGTTSPCAANATGPGAGITITVNQPSVAATSLTASPNVICNGGSSILTQSGGSLGTGATWKWYSDNTYTTLVGTGSGATASLTVSPLATTTYYLRAEGATAPCTANITGPGAGVTITVNQPSIAPATLNASSSPICNGNSTILTQSGGSLGTGASWKWYSDNTYTTLVGTGSGVSASLTVSPLVTTTYYLRVEGTTSPCTANADGPASGVTVVVNQKSGNPTSATASPQNICFGDNVTLTLAGGGNGVNETIVWYTGSCGGTIAGTGNNLVVSPGVTTTYYGRYENGTPCNAVSLCVQVTVNVTIPGTWLGITNNWHNPVNWCGGVPTSSTNVVIPFMASGIYPWVFLLNARAHDITMAAGTSLTVDNRILRVSGDILNNGAVLDITDGTLELNGTGSSQNIAGSLFLENTIEDLQISNASGVNLTGVNDTLKLSGVLKFGTSNATLNTNGNLTLLSSASGTASVGDMTNNGANSGNNIIGNVTVERFIPNHFKAWQFLAVPTSGQTVNNAWQEGNAPLSNSNNPGYGTIITSNVPGAVALGFDVYTAAGPSMKTYDSASNGWIGIPTPAMPIANKKGYMLFVRGDRSVTVFNQAPTSTILRTTGQLYTIGVDAPPVTDLNAGTFESIGNPYASAIDFNNVTKTGGVQDIFYVWDPKLTTNLYSVWGLGAYQTFIGPGPNYTVVPGGGSYSGNNVMIESGQAFFVHAPFADGSVSFTESCKVDGSNLVTKPSNAQVKQLRNNLYVFTAGNPVLLDGTLAQFDIDYSNAIDKLDAVKIANSSENLSILRDGKKLVAERRAEIQNTDTIFYNLGLLRVQQYQFEFIAANLDHSGLSAFLEDNYLQTSTPVSLQDTTRVMFNVVNIPGSYAADRFRLVFQRLAPTPVTITSIAANRNSDKSIAIAWKTENETNIQLYTIERSEDGYNFNGIITADPVANNGGRASYTKNDISPLMKDNFYRIKALSFGGQLQYSAIVKVAPVKLAAGITVYPNPVIGKTVQLQFVDQLKGKYAVTLLYSNGQQQQLPGIEAGAGTGTYSVVLPQLLASGVYRLRITGPGNSSILKTIHVSTGQ